MKVTELIRIEPDWNVNLFLKVSSLPQQLIIRIEPDWNVNTRFETSFVIPLRLE